MGSHSSSHARLGFAIAGVGRDELAQEVPHSKNGRVNSDPRSLPDSLPVAVSWLPKNSARSHCFFLLYIYESILRPPPEREIIRDVEDRRQSASAICLFTITTVDPT